jgi:hypothetical protein
MSDHKMSDEIRTTIAALESDAVNEINPTEMSLSRDADEALEKQGPGWEDRRAASYHFRKASQQLDAAIDALMRALRSMELAEKAEQLAKERLAQAS